MQLTVIVQQSAQETALIKPPSVGLGWLVAWSGDDEPAALHPIVIHIQSTPSHWTQASIWALNWTCLEFFFFSFFSHRHVLVPSPPPIAKHPSSSRRDIGMPLWFEGEGILIQVVVSTWVGPAIAKLNKCFAQTLRMIWFQSS